ncbi:MAG: response regulator transcription factor [Caldilineaceae bacterium]|nr:response regulator transcription factor [Caldilineaceae bacterium]MCB0140708.1 response regulator transcription factor [Caldilineaceae bacterium]
MSEKKTRILVVEDEDLLLELLTKTLQTSGYEVLTAKNGVDALELAIENEVDLILLDVMMPRMNGFTFCEEVRKLSDVPIIMLTALNRPDDVARGLQLGADEYITKPFSFRELNVRIQSILRRVSWNKGSNNFSVLSIDDIVLNVIDEKVTVRNQEVELTPMEYKLLHYLMMRPNQPVNNDTLLRDVWEYEGGESPSIIQSVVRRLRLKIEDEPSDPKHVVSIWGVGYKFQT